MWRVGGKGVVCPKSCSEAKGIWQDGQADQRGKNLCGARGYCIHL